MMQALGSFTEIKWRWIVFFAGIIAAWSVLFALEADRAALKDYADIDASFWTSICSTAATDTSVVVLFAMWGLMSAAMMTPTAGTAFKTYDDLTHTSAADGTGFFALIGGYVMAWLGFSAAAAVTQAVLAGAGVLDPTGQSINAGLNAILLLSAGLYQFSPLKEACLSKCRTPMMFFLAEWRDGPRGAFVMGMKLGINCIGCCWALMLIGFVGGAMNLLWMGFAMVLMTTEKLPSVGRHITRPIGFVLLLAAAWAALNAIGVF